MQNRIKKIEHENVSIAEGLEQRVSKCGVSSWSVKSTNSLLPSFVATRTEKHSTCPASSGGSSKPSVGSFGLMGDSQNTQYYSSVRSSTERTLLESTRRLKQVSPPISPSATFLLFIFQTTRVLFSALTTKDSKR